MKKDLFVAGTFNDEGGKPSKVAAAIEAGLGFEVELYNGGNFSDLEKLMNRLPEFKLIFWFANVANDKPKLIKEVKKKSPRAILVSSKRNTEGEYGILEIINKALLVHANLTVEFQRKDGKFVARVLDPLGNSFGGFTDDMETVGRTLAKRIAQLKAMTRVGSQKAGEMIEPPDEKEFYELVKSYADEFHDLIHVADTNKRLLGNASFRCERGFPSVKSGEVIFVSRRNVDKRFIEKSGFVAVPLNENLSYYGDLKPSVDTPVQLKLYAYYPNINYMLHSHVYIKDAPFTQSVLPCGAVEEADEVIKTILDKETEFFSVNLRGHGALIASKTLEKMKNIPYISRSLPEDQSSFI